ncbi:MAG: cation:proton antiporter [Cellulosilyticaceae bacterium]
MLTSLALIFLCGMVLSSIAKKCKLPDLVGMLLTGMVLGPYALGVLDPTILEIAPDLRKMALVIILIRAGLGLDLEALKKVGRPAVLMCFVPAVFEITGVLIMAPVLFGVSLIEAAILGTVLAAVSPAVIVPRMLKLMDEGYGCDKSIPQLVMAGASVDDIFVIVLFTSFTGMAAGGSFSASTLMNVPISIVLGIGAGIAIGLGLTYFFKKVHLRDSSKVIIFLSMAFLLVGLEDGMKDILPFSGLIAIMTIGIVIYREYAVLAKRLSVKFTKLWLAAQILLFVLVGSTVDLSYALKSTLPALGLIGFALVFRAIGVMVCLVKTKLSFKERVFCVLAYMPKATVQAAIGGIPLAMGLPCGEMVLTVAVIAIVLTAPLGALGIDSTYKKWLKAE